MFKLTRLSSVFLKSTPKFSPISNLSSSSRFFSVSLLKNSSSPLANALPPSSNYSPILSTLIGNRFYSSGSISKEMEAYLTEEIKAEKASSKPVSGVPGFEIKTDGAQIELTRQFKDEKIRIRLNVNGSTNQNPPDVDIENPSPLYSRPEFSIEITKPSGKTLCLSCNLDDQLDESAFDDPNQTKPSTTSHDVFSIDAITVLDKPDDEMDSNIYMGDASLIDGQLYDILMDYLDERGIGKEFATHLIDYCTSYENERYIQLLEDMKNFVSH